MGYRIKTALLPKVITNNGIESIQFVSSDCTYQEDNIQFVTPYYNPITGEYDISKSMLYFGGSQTLLIDQTYEATEVELNA